MGLFRRRRQKHGIVAPEVVKAAAATAEVVMAETTTAEEPAEVPRREVAAERRPDPDRPGWGRTIGQEIGKARQSHRGED